MLRQFLAIILIGLLTPTLGAAQNEAVSSQWWRDRVFYEVFVRSFQDSDGEGNGDLKGLISRLDYLNDGDPTTDHDLGVGGIWLMPIMESPAYHGYHVTDFMTVEPDYGTNEDFKRLMDEAHRRDLRVIVDLTINHTSRVHPWFLEAQKPGSPKEQWYRWSGGRPGQVGPWGQQVWHPLGNRYYYGVFDGYIPDLNLRNPAVTQAINEVTRFWLEEMGADGFRLDAARYLVEDGNTLASSEGNFTWLKRWHEFVKSVKPESFVVGEVWTNSIEVARYVPAQLDMAFEFDLAGGMTEAARRGDAGSLVTVQRRASRLFSTSGYAAFLTNHDQTRVMTALANDLGKARVAASLLLTNPGVPFIYYGEEIGMIGSKPNDPCLRAQMQWDSGVREPDFMDGMGCAINPTDANVRDQLDDPNSLLSHYRNLIHLRELHPALHSGDMILLDSDNSSIYAYFRRAADEIVLVVINLSNRPVTQYSLSLADWSSGPFVGAEWLLGAGDFNLPIVKESGIAPFQPTEELAPQSTSIIQLTLSG